MSEHPLSAISEDSTSAPDTAPTRVAFQNVGCKLNQYEVEALQDGFQRRGYEVVPFDEIQPGVTEGRVEAGLLIHEGQLTYADEGLRNLVDLGVWWADRTGGLPLPLGCNVIRRDLGMETIRRVSRLLHDSIAHALSHRTQAIEYALDFGRGLDADRTNTFVGMYVNALTLDYGARGRAAVERLFAEAYDHELIPKPVRVEFVE